MSTIYSKDLHFLAISEYQISSTMIFNQIMLIMLYAIIKITICDTSTIIALRFNYM